MGGFPRFSQDNDTMTNTNTSSSGGSGGATRNTTKSSLGRGPANATADAGGSPATADGIWQRLCTTQEDAMRQLAAERTSALAQVTELEATIKELVAAMDDATQAKVDLQSDFDAFKREADEGREALVQAIDAAQEGSGQAAEHERRQTVAAVRLGNLEAHVARLRDEKLRLRTELNEKKEEIAALNRWNRQEIRDRREAEREVADLRKAVAKHLRRAQARNDHDGDVEAAAAARASETAVLEAKVASLEDELRRLAAAREQAEAAAAEAQANLERCELELGRVMDKAAAQDRELTAARDEAYAMRVQAEQEVEARVREALAEREAEVASLRATLAERAEDLARLEGQGQGQEGRLCELEAMREAAQVALEGEKGQVRALEKRVELMQAVVDEAQAKARQSVDEIIHLRIREDELVAKVAELEASHADYEARLAALRGERDDWRLRAETEVAEWVGVAMEGDDAAGAGVAKEEEGQGEPDDEDGDDRAGTKSPATLPPDSDDLGGLDPVQALMEENTVLRNELERLRAEKSA